MIISHTARFPVNSLVRRRLGNTVQYGKVVREPDSDYYVRVLYEETERDTVTYEGMAYMSYWPVNQTHRVKPAKTSPEVLERLTRKVR